MVRRVIGWNVRTGKQILLLTYVCLFLMCCYYIPLNKYQGVFGIFEIDINSFTKFPKLRRQKQFVNDADNKANTGNLSKNTAILQIDNPKLLPHIQEPSVYQILLWSELYGGWNITEWTGFDEGKYSI